MGEAHLSPTHMQLLGIQKISTGYISIRLALLLLEQAEGKNGGTGAGSKF